VIGSLSFASVASAQSLVCPVTTSNTSFSGTTASTDCSATITTGCTSKAGVVFNGTTSLLTLPGSGGNFQRPPGDTFQDSVYYASAGDFDKDGWTDFVAITATDDVYVMRNQTITCDMSGCTGGTSTAPSVASITTAQWSVLTNQRKMQFRRPYSSAGTARSIKASSGGSNTEEPVVSGDFDGDGWTDFVVVSDTGNTGGNPRWPTAARLFLNTKNCHDASNVPCGVGMLCGTQTSNGVCSGGSTAGSGTAWADTQLSCTNSSASSCQKYYPTFASYDARTGAAVTGNGTTSSTTTISPSTTNPGDFGPIGHSASNTFALDFDGDGDIDFLMAHSGGTCPSGLCATAGRVIYPGIDVWLNDCAQSGSWNATTKSCAGYIPRFSRGTSFCTSGSAACNDPQSLIPSTSHNNSTILPNANINFDVDPRQNVAFAYVDIDNDNDYDLVVGSPGCCTTGSNAPYQLRVYKGTSNSKTVHMLDTSNPINLSTTSSTYPGFTGSATAILASDFSGDGYADFMVAGEGAAISVSKTGVFYWKNSGNSATPFGASWPTCTGVPTTCASGCSTTCNPSPQVLAMADTSSTNPTGSSHSTLTYNLNPGTSTGNPLGLPVFGDFDTGILMDYDHDPSNTQDMILTNGNDVNQFYLFANRATPSIVAACGTVVSGTLPPPNGESTVSGACLTPSATVPSGTSITYYLNNESPANYVMACRQTGTSTFSPALTGGQCCVSFTNITGRTITWKAVMDSNTTDGTDVCTATGTTSPSISSVAANYTYTAADQHYKAGVVVYDGITYSGTFTQPGNRGHFYALAAGTGSKYYDFATSLDAQSSRNIYLTNESATSTRLDFVPTSPSSTLQSALGSTTAAAATNTINWVLSARFGSTANGFAYTKLGAVQNSTPAILAPPFLPKWYGFLSLQEKSPYDTFQATYKTRLPLVLFASMDGMLHAVISAASNISESHNGTEAWGFIPPGVAKNMQSDYTASQSGTLTVTSYPDGSPALVDFKKANGTIASAAIFSGGDGSKATTVLDVTDTISSAFSVSGKGPLPMWSAEVPSAGLAKSKPGVARVKIAGNEAYVLVAGSGTIASDANAGKIVVGYNLETGAVLWKYEMMCPLTSDITTFDTDDTGTYEPGSPLLDGFADRAVFADNCGYVYKVNPGQDLSGGWMGNSGYGPITLAAANGVSRTALFSTASTSGALGSQRPIVGALGALADNTTDMVLFFGTGGVESQSTSLVNEFYAIYAKSGVIRSKVTGTCSGGRCEKFYGGVVVTTDSVIVARSVDPVIGSGSCDFGSGTVTAFGLNSPFSQVFNLTSIAGVAMKAISSPLFGDAGAIYFATADGKVDRVGTPRATSAGADSTAGATQQSGSTTTTYTNGPLTFLGWRNVL
jgi:hypothetical protein